MTPMRRLPVFLAFLFLLSAACVLAQEPQHALVEIRIESQADADFLRENRGRLDIVYAKPGVFVHVAAQPDELQFLRAAGLNLKILERDLEAANAYADKSTNFGIFHTWSENIAFVDSLRLLYPQVISQKWSLGQTHEGRDLWCFRVSANPDTDEDEPEILIDGMHHAREIMSSEFVIMFAEYLAQNYGTDPEITWLLDNRELYLVPVVNPDGVVYNELMAPQGGGMWRKNRRNNGNGTYGVDPNRNYPYQWAYDNIGSDPSSSSETYRGPAAGSEPEVQAIMNFFNSHNVRTHNTVHCYSNVTLLPWGYAAVPNPDAAIYDHIATEMTRYNHYGYGTPMQTINYPVNGGTFDWVYGDTSGHAKAFSVSNEIGSSSDGFWPDPSRRQALFQDNIWPNLYLMRAAGPYLTAHSPDFLPPVLATTGAGPMEKIGINPGETGDLTFTVENQSLFSSSLGVALTVRTDDPWVLFGAAERSVGSLPSLGTTDLSGDPIPVTVDPLCPAGHRVNFTVTIHMVEGDLDFILSFTVGTAPVIFTEDFGSGTDAWTLGGTWAPTSSQSHSPSQSLTDSPGGNYDDDSSTAATLDGQFRATTLGFWTAYDIEDGYDYGLVQVSADGGPWTTVKSYTGLQASWVYEEIQLGSFAGQDLQFRFALVTDTYVTEDGWYIDDITIRGTPGANGIPATPLAVSPLGGAVSGDPANLTVANSSDPEGSPVVYGFRIYDDLLCTSLVASVDNLAEGAGSTAWTAPSLADGAYWWRAWAGDGVDRSLLNGPEAFTIFGASAVDDLVLDHPRLRVITGLGAPGAILQLDLPGSAAVNVDIYDLRGARVRSLRPGNLGGGTHNLVWDGNDGHGRTAASGVYFVRLRAGDDVLTGRVAMIR